MIKMIFIILSITILFLLPGYFGNSQAQNAFGPASQNDYIFTDDFSGYSAIANQCLKDGTLFGNWQISFNGYGCTRIISITPTDSFLFLSPKISTSSDELHAALVLGPSFSDKFVYEVDVNTRAQQRTGSTPNHWEVGWILWDYTDETHAYYFTPKENGWELGKLDPAYQGGQRYLVTDNNPTFPINNWYHIKIVQDGNNITVFVDDNYITSFTDIERPYTQGRIGLYDEDAMVYFDNVKVSTDQSNLGSLTVPTSPTGLQAIPVSSSEIDLSWTAPINNGGSEIIGYKIERSRDGGTNWITVTPNTGSTATTYAHSPISSDSTYTYRIYAINGMGISPASDATSATTLPYHKPSSSNIFSLPAPPAGLQAIPVSSSEIDLSWTAPINNGSSAIIGYKIDRSRNGGLTWAPVTENTETLDTIFSHIGITAGSTYTYRVYAINSDGISPPSNNASATTLFTPPTPPIDLKATTVSLSEIDLTWTAPTNNGGAAIMGYKIEKSTDGGVIWDTINANTGNLTTTYSHTGLAKDGTFTYRVYAINSIGASFSSNNATAKTSTSWIPKSNTPEFGAFTGIVILLSIICTVIISSRFKVDKNQTRK